METPKAIGNTASKTTTKKEQYSHVLHSYLYDLNLTVYERILLIYCNCNSENWTFIPKVASKKTGICSETVYDLLNSLVEKGYCIKTKGKKFKPDNYTFFDKPITVAIQDITVRSATYPSLGQQPTHRKVSNLTTPLGQQPTLNNTISNNIIFNTTISNNILKKEELVELSEEELEEIELDRLEALEYKRLERNGSSIKKPVEVKKSISQQVLTSISKPEPEPIVNKNAEMIFNEIKEEYTQEKLSSLSSIKKEETLLHIIDFNIDFKEGANLSSTTKENIKLKAREWFNGVLEEKDEY